MVVVVVVVVVCWRISLYTNFLSTMDTIYTIIITSRLLVKDDLLTLNLINHYSYAGNCSSGGLVKMYCHGATNIYSITSMSKYFSTFISLA